MEANEWENVFGDMHNFPWNVPNCYNLSWKYKKHHYKAKHIGLAVIEIPSNIQKKDNLFLIYKDVSAKKRFYKFILFFYPSQKK